MAIVFRAAVELVVWAIPGVGAACGVVTWAAGGQQQSKASVSALIALCSHDMCEIALGSTVCLTPDWVAHICMHVLLEAPAVVALAALPQLTEFSQTAAAVLCCDVRCVNSPCAAGPRGNCDTVLFAYCRARGASCAYGSCGGRTSVLQPGCHQDLPAPPNATQTGEVGQKQTNERSQC
jgi:hypothetical protein